MYKPVIDIIDIEISVFEISLSSSTFPVFQVYSDYPMGGDGG